MCSHNYSDTDCDLCKGPEACVAKLEAELAASEANCSALRARVSTAENKVSFFEARAEKAEAALKAFRPVDDQDWNYIDSLIGQGGRDRFWRAVFTEIRAALKEQDNG